MHWIQEKPLVNMNNLLSIKNLTINFKENQNVVDNVSIDIPKGKTVAIVGESGSGKTLSALSILKLLPTNAFIKNGSIIFNDKDLLKLPQNKIEKIRGNKISTIFQEPMSSLNPLHKIDKQIKEIITTHNNKANSEELDQSVLKLLKEVNLDNLMNRPNIYSYELSGGQRQRVVIARALVTNPKIIIADEPVSMLDVSVRGEILELLSEIQKNNNISLIYITHDLATAKFFANKIIILYSGKIMESGFISEVLDNPKHPYTQALIDAISKPDPKNLYKEKNISWKIDN